MDQDQQRVRRYRDFGRRVFGSIFSAAKYCPDTKNSTPVSSSPRSLLGSDYSCQTSLCNGLIQKSATAATREGVESRIHDPGVRQVAENIIGAIRA